MADSEIARPDPITIRKSCDTARANCDQCDTCILPSSLRPLSAPTEPATSITSESISALGAAYLNQLMHRIADGRENSKDLIHQAACFTTALELALTRPTDSTAMISAQSLYSGIWRDVDTVARRRRVMVLWRIDHNPALAPNGQDRALEGMRQLCIGATKLVSEGGNLLIDLSRNTHGGLDVSFSASSIRLPNEWNRIRADNGACPIPMNALCTLRIGLKLLGLPPTALSMQHHYSQSVLSLQLRRPLAA